MANSRSAGDVSVRFSVQDKEAVRIALEQLGKDGAAALERINTAGHAPSRSLQALSIAMGDARNFATGLSGELGSVGAAMGAFGTVGIATSVVLGGLYVAFSKVKEGAKDFGQFTRNIRDNAEAVGLSAEQYQASLLILQKHGLEEEKAAAILQKLGKAREEAAHADGALYNALREQSPELARQFALSTSLAQATDIFAKALVNATEKKKIFLMSSAGVRGSALAIAGFEEIFNKGGLDAATEGLVNIGRIFQKNVIDTQSKAAQEAAERAQTVERAWNEAYASIYSKWKDFKKTALGIDPDAELKILTKLKVELEKGSDADFLKLLIQFAGAGSSNSGGSYVHPGVALGQRFSPWNSITTSEGNLDTNKLFDKLKEFGEDAMDIGRKIGMGFVDFVKIPGDAMGGRYGRKPAVPGQWSEDDEYWQQVNAGKELPDALRLAGWGLSARGGAIRNLIPESFPGTVARQIIPGLIGGQSADSFSDRFGSFPGGATRENVPIPSARPKAALSDDDLKNRLQESLPNEQRRLALLGDTASAEEKLKFKVDQLTLARLHHADISDEEAARIKRNYEVQSAAQTLAVRVHLGLAGEEEIATQKLMELQEQLAKAGVVSAEQRATAEKIVRKEALETANAVKVRASDTPALTKLAQDGNNLAKTLDDNLAGALRGVGQEFSLLNTSTDSFGKKLQNISLRIADAAYQAVIMKAVVGPLANLLSGGLGSAFGFVGGLTKSASGNVFDQGNMVRFASGGVLTRPMMFPFANGVGLAGEAGPEAIMPLARDAAGRLGVRGGGGMHVEQHFHLDGAMTRDEVVDMVKRGAAVAVRQANGFTASSLRQYDGASLGRLQQKRSLEG